MNEKRRPSGGQARETARPRRTAAPTPPCQPSRRWAGAPGANVQVPVPLSTTFVIQLQGWGPEAELSLPRAKCHALGAA